MTTALAPALDDIIEEMAREVEKVRQQLHDDLDQVQHALVRISHDTGIHIQSCQDVLNRAAAASRPPINRVVNEQQQLAQGWRHTLETVCVDYDELTTRGSGHCDAIVTAGRGMRDLARSSRRVALNAAIRALSCGDQGAAITVIAGHMRTLSDQVEDATQRIGILAVELAGAIEEVSEHSTELSNLSGSFGETVAARTGRLQVDVGELAELLEDSTQVSDGGLRDLLDASRSARKELECAPTLDQHLHLVEVEVRALQVM